MITKNILTALLRSGVNPQLRDRASLARAMGVSTSTVGKWFATLDSQGCPRDPVVPARHLVTIAELFELCPDDFDKPEAEFKNWCFELAQQRKNKCPTPSPDEATSPIVSSSAPTTTMRWMALSIPLCTGVLLGYQWLDQPKRGETAALVDQVALIEQNFQGVDERLWSQTQQQLDAITTIAVRDLALVAEAAHRLGLAAFERGEWARAQDYQQRALQLFPERLPYQIALAQAQFKQGELEAAEQRVLSALLPNGVGARNQEQVAQVLLALDEAELPSPDNRIRVLQMLGGINCYSRRHHVGAAYFQAALQQAEYHRREGDAIVLRRSLLVAEGWAHLQSEQWQQAQQVLRQLLPQEPMEAINLQTVHAAIGLGEAAYAQQQYAQASTWFSQAFEHSTSRHIGNTWLAERTHERLLRTQEKLATL